MNVPNDFDFLIKEEKLDPLTEQNENGAETCQKERVVSLPLTERQDDSIGHDENNKDPKTDIYREIKPDYFLHEYVKEEASFQYCATDLEESLQDPLALNDMKVENIKKEDSQTIEHIKEEQNIELKEEYIYKDSKYKIEIEEHKVEYSSDGDHTVTRYNEAIITSSGEIGKSKVSSEDTDISNEIIYGHELCEVIPGFRNNSKFINEGMLSQICQKYYKTLPSGECLKNSNDSAHEVNKYKCKECHKVFSNDRNLKLHIDKIHKGSKYECNLCPKTFSNPYSLKRHVDCVHKGIKRYECNECKKTFSQAAYLKIHCDSFHKGIKYECYICHKFYSTHSTLKNHVDCVHKGKRWVCNICHEMLSTYHTLKKHVECMHNTIRSKKYECNECNRQFSNALNLKYHHHSITKE